MGIVNCYSKFLKCKEACSKKQKKKTKRRRRFTMSKEDLQYYYFQNSPIECSKAASNLNTCYARK